MLIFRRGPLHPSTPTFDNIILTETMTNLIVAWKFNFKNLCLYPKSFHITLKPNSYLMSISRRGPVNPSTPTFPNINLTKPIKNLLVILKITENLLL